MTATVTKSTAPSYTHVTIVLNPSVVKREGLFRFPVPVAATGKEPVVELNGKIPFLTPGSNLIEVEVHEAMSKSPYFDRFVKNGVLKVFIPEIPEGGRVTGTSADYANFEAAVEIIEQSNDLTWLELCKAKDDRDGIARTCQERIAAIQSELNRQPGDSQ